MMLKIPVRRRRWLVGVAGVAALALAWSAAASPRFADLPGSKAAGSIEVDVELVMAVDISYSMDMDELALQREGYAQAIASQEFLNALKQGSHGKIAVTLVEWAGVSDQRVVVPWRLIGGAANCRGRIRRQDWKKLAITYGMNMPRFLHSRIARALKADREERRYRRPAPEFVGQSNPSAA